MTVLVPTQTLQASPSTALVTAFPGFTMLGGAPNGELLATPTAGLNTATTTTFTSPAATWTGAPATFPADQYVQCTLSAATGSNPLAILARAGGTTLIALAIIPSSSQIALRYTTAYSSSTVANNMTLVSATTGNALLTGISPALAANDVLRLTVQGTGASMTIVVARQVGGSGAFVNFAAPFGTNISAAVQAIASGRPGVLGAAGTLWGIRNFEAGDLVTGPLPPTPPATSKGAFTVRTT